MWDHSWFDGCPQLDCRVSDEWPQLNSFIHTHKQSCMNIILNLVPMTILSLLSIFFQMANCSISHSLHVHMRSKSPSSWDACRLARTCVYSDVESDIFNKDIAVLIVNVYKSKSLDCSAHKDCCNISSKDNCSPEHSPSLMIKIQYKPTYTHGHVHRRAAF